MRGDFKNRKIFKSVRVSYQVTGLNQDRLISQLKRRDIHLYDIKKVSNRVMYLSVNLNESDNFFAITKNLCYNIKKVRLYGKGLPAYKLFTSLGLAVGALVFFVLSLLSSDYILGVSFSGSGSVYKREVLEYLSSRGITEYTRFSAFRTDKLEDEILSSEPNLTFVSVQKKGNILAVYMTLKKTSTPTLSGKAQELRATVGGRVESVKVYRGTAQVEIGDVVSVGDLLVDGYAIVKEQVVQTGVLACVTIIESRAYTYRFSGRDKEDVAIALAEQEEKDRETVSSFVTVKEISGSDEFLYCVTVEYRTALYAG